MKKFQSKSGFAPAVVIGIVALILLVGAGVWFISRESTAPKNKKGEVANTDKMMSEEKDSAIKDGEMTKQNESVMKKSETKDAMTGKTKIISITAQNFTFSQNEIRVKKDDRVKINFESASGFHDWVVDEFGARTAQINTGEKTSVEFVADKAGEFEYYCSVGQHRQMGMKGKLIVE